MLHTFSVNHIIGNQMKLLIYNAQVFSSDSNTVFQFRVIVTTDNTGTLIEVPKGYRFSVKKSDDDVDFELMFNELKQELYERVPNLDITYTDLALTWDSDGYHIRIEGGNDLQIALEDMQNSSVYQIFLELQPKGMRFR